MPAITVYRPRDEVERAWQDSQFRPEGTVTFREAPGDRGTEIHVEVDGGGVLKKLTGSDPYAKAMDDLRHFKQLVETGEITRSDATPEGEHVQRKLKQRPGQPLDDAELEKAGT
jgi:uncharacterized membrane protein